MVQFHIFYVVRKQCSLLHTFVILPSVDRYDIWVVTKVLVKNLLSLNSVKGELFNKDKESPVLHMGTDPGKKRQKSKLFLHCFSVFTIVCVEEKIHCLSNFILYF